MTDTVKEEPTTTTWSTGAGVVDSVNSFVDSLKSDAEGEGPDVIDVALGGAGMVVDVVSTLGDPFNSLATAGIGWLLEHVDFLREPLDALLGNPDEINANIDQLKSAALEMKMIAQEHREDMASMTDWEGQSSEAFRSNMEQMAGEYEALGSTMDGTAAVYALSGTLVCELRSLVFEQISDLIWQLIKAGLTALGAAAVSLGSSIAAFIGWAGTRAAMLATKIVGRLSRLAAAMARMGARIAKLTEKMSGLIKGLERFSEVGGYAKSAYDAIKPYEMPPAQA